MPYRDKEQEREAARLRKQRQRSRPDVTPSDVTPSAVEDVTPEVALPPEWAHVRDFIRSESSGMPKLERLQRIAGSLGKYADGVYFGDLTMGEIGRVIGVLPPLVTTPRL